MLFSIKHALYVLLIVNLIKKKKPAQLVVWLMKKILIQFANVKMAL